MSKVVYAGTWSNEGHDVTFIVNDDDVTLSETYNGKDLPNVNVSIDDAISKQEQYIKWGYINYA
jgi:hypothetical protein